VEGLVGTADIGEADVEPGCFVAEPGCFVAVDLRICTSGDGEPVHV
jgi:hypothetical protein